MRVAVLGAGNIGRAIAAYLQDRGHAAVVWARSDASGRRTVRTTGKFSASAEVAFEKSLARCIQGADVVLTALPAHALREVLEAAAGAIVPGQVVLVAPAPSASPLVIAQALAARGVRTPVAGLAATVLTARAQADGSLLVGAVRSSVGFACVEDSHREQVQALCENLFGTSFLPLDDVLALALGYVTPVVHGPLMLCNISRIEKGESWREFECTTPAISRLVEALDAERLAIAAACGVRIPSFVDHCNASFGTRHDRYQPIAESVAAARNGGPLGPVSLEARQIAEDMPYGLAVYARLGRLAGVETPLTRSVLDTLSALCGRPFDQENAMVEFLDQAFSARPRSTRGHHATDSRGC